MSDIAPQWALDKAAKAAGWDNYGELVLDFPSKHTTRKSIEAHAATMVAEITDDQLEAQCTARGWEVKKPLVTQAERDRLADAFKVFGLTSWGNNILDGVNDPETRAFIDTYEGAGQ